MKLHDYQRSILWALIVGGVAISLPLVAETYTLINATIYVSAAIFALSLALIWGYGGILCFGQAAFFGLGGYAYALTSINFGDTTLAIPIAVATATIFAVMLGYFLFYGRLGDVYLGVITLTVTLILFKLINSTAGDAYRVGKARLGGFNGIPNTPPLNWPFQPDHIATPGETYVAASVALVLLYAFCKWLLVTRFGRAVIAIRENEVRAELLGYNSRLVKLAIFSIGAAIAGLSGAVFATTVFVSPTMFSLGAAAQVLIWVIVGGLGTLVGPIIGSIVVQMLTSALGTVEWINPNFVLGVVLVAVVLVAPKGLMHVFELLKTVTRKKRLGPEESAHDQA
ncbi:branched-chain amino acid ABC transporter permease [Bradyrhizobium diazoefficiens]|nr:branched-chain amino acid ABC transporter permease [Bradyrhizobium diazoefficiens]QQN66715.1 branched-chain amino acid ABC transporter permease [Bradyrhizobium diazoefficiens]